VIAACRRLKESGYTIALDEFGINDPREALTDVADIIKVDLRETSALDAAAMVKRYRSWRRRMLAEKVETRGVHGCQEGWLSVLPGIFLPPPGSTHGA
jgi:c-di-GMP-related signal transduction protein